MIKGDILFTVTQKHRLRLTIRSRRIPLPNASCLRTSMSGRPHSGFLCHSIQQVSSTSLIKYLFCWFFFPLAEFNFYSQLPKFCIQIFIAAWCNGAINGVHLEWAVINYQILLNFTQCDTFLFDTHPIGHQKPILLEDLSSSIENTL